MQLDLCVFTRGNPPYHYLKLLGAHFFLTVNEADARAALNAVFPAAQAYAISLAVAEPYPHELPIGEIYNSVIGSTIKRRRK